MGRAGRPNGEQEIPQALRELEEEGLPPGWKRYWQGERRDIKEESARESLIQEADIVEAMRRSSSTNIQEFSDELTAIWRGELQRLDRIIEYAEYMRASPLSGINNADLYLPWKEDLAPSLNDFLANKEGLPPSWSIMRAVLQDGALWDSLDSEWLAWSQRDPQSWREFVQRDLSSVCSHYKSRPAIPIFKGGCFQLSRKQILDALLPPVEGISILDLSAVLRTHSDMDGVYTMLAGDRSAQICRERLSGEDPPDDVDIWKSAAVAWTLEALQATGRDYVQEVPSHLKEIQEKLLKHVGGDRALYEDFVRQRLKSLDFNYWKRIMRGDIDLEDVMLAGLGTI